MGILMKVLHHIVAFATVALAVAIAVIVALKFYQIDVVSNNTNVSVEAACLLGTDVGSKSLCTYVFIVCGVSVGVSLAISIVQCLTCELCGLGGCLDFLFAIAGSVWWIVAAAIVTNDIHGANSADFPEQNWRNTVMALMWVEAACFVFLVITGALRLCCL